MRLKLLVVLAVIGGWAGACAGVGAQAPAEVLVTAPRLAGYWALTGPNMIRFAFGITTGIRILYSGDTDVRDICLLQRQQPELSVTCAAGASSSGVGGIAANHIRMRWWMGPANLIFQGAWNGKTTIEGNFSGGIVGIRVTGRIPARLDKIHASAKAGPHRKALLMVLDDLRAGVWHEASYEPEGLKRARRAQAWKGAQEAFPSVAYLGDIHIHWQRKQPNLVESVYEIRVVGHVSLCRIAVDDKGLIRDFACVQAPSLDG